MKKLLFLFLVLIMTGDSYAQSTQNAQPKPRNKIILKDRDNMGNLSSLGVKFSITINRVSYKSNGDEIPIPDPVYKDYQDSSVQLTFPELDYNIVKKQHRKAVESFLKNDHTLKELCEHIIILKRD